jgi:dienelactone hydrolase
VTPLSLEPRSREPLAAWFSHESEPARRFELASSGDRVNGLLLLPAAPPPHPVVIALHDLGSHVGDPGFRAPLERWRAQGLAVAAIDFPLHGERASAKLTRRALAAAQAGESAPPADRALWCELVAQGVRDLARTLDAFAGRPELDAARIAFVGLGLGARVGAVYVGLDARVRAAVLAGGANTGPEPIRPAPFVARITPRPLLFVNVDDGRDREAVDALHSGAREPKRVVWSPPAERLLERPEVARFLAEALAR